VANSPIGGWSGGAPAATARARWPAAPPSGILHDPVPPRARDKGAFMKDVVVLGGARTAMADYNGAFPRITESALGAPAARAALDRTAVPLSEIQHVVFGNALQTSGNAIYGARHVGLKAGVPIEPPALTVNRLCGSGIQSIISAAQLIKGDE